MSNSLVASPMPGVAPDVQEFAVAKEINRYLNAVIDLARQAFPSSSLSVSLGQDAEDDAHQYVALDVDVRTLTAEEVLAGQRTWSAGVRRVCPSRYAVYFVLGWR